MISEDSISETDQQIQTFLKNLTNALTTRKAKNIEGYFDPKFSFRGCLDIFSLNGLIYRLENIPKSKQAKFFCETWHWADEGIRMVVHSEGLGQISKMPMELLLNSDKRVLISGASVHCKRKQFVNVAALTETPFEYRSAP
ncbi:hypothetical protein L3Y34_012904 [Caenorhabditis briggsae]|uniref:NTF2-like domain-containing protein n=1 Tax=Caenorhabditis briggsae TaxID=6238 RepID=A0AAE8ZTU3_CAEBR|nr:hypothetical protein L3Y34_012904 [Caenorhabditis briggsae]